MRVPALDTHARGTVVEFLPLRNHMRITRALAAAVLAVSRALAGAQQTSPAAPAAATLVLTGGNVFTADSARPWAEALAIRGDRIVAVGTTADVRRLAGRGTREIVLAGRVVIPGINDAHDHLGQVPVGIVVRTSAAPTPDPTTAEVLDSLRAVAARTAAGTWITVTVGGRADAPALPGAAGLIRTAQLPGRHRPRHTPRRVAAQLHLHVTGDSTTALVLNLMEALAPESAWRPHRVRFEHGPGLTGPQIARARRLGVVIAQPRPEGAPLQSWLAAGSRTGRTCCGTRSTT